ncbi:HupE/UreJ family protein [Segetibacter sp. 3557_3]|uniref:HupE/UreJ family protein n=1 Tax=Segetibacter sp. 3557_3 TaxID=2547429 RepID=UPI0010591294|nr:HupE/UreJ family protein [Segetibacter sp. 3557_3]TDH29034.1 HupE/UreJ family protein [Segetibacter sp. 3557_3]
MHEFALYFKLGWQHIADLRGIDHIIFLLAMCLPYQLKDWKKLLLLVTAFTIGHSITLLLSVVNVIRYRTAIIEFVIPVTIIITASTNLFAKNLSSKGQYPLVYWLALVFGLVHGLGFSNYLKSLLGRNSNIFLQLFSFNIGLEAGQLMIVIALMTISFILLTLLKVNQRAYMLVVSGGILSLAIEMAIQRLP